MLSNLVAWEGILERGDSIDAVSNARLENANNVAPFGHRSESVSRSELKFSITENMAARIREAASLQMSRDPHCSTDGTYEVHTMYLDSPDMAIYRKSLHREADRFKLRMRFYNDDPSSPVFLEIKQTASGIKKRLRVNRESTNALFATNDFWKCRKATTPEEFWETVRRFKARPIIHIAYVREAFVCRHDPGNRLTLDRSIRCQAAPDKLTTAMHNPIHIWQGKVILEIKFAGEMPFYFRDLIRSFGLETAKASKYMEGVSSRLG